MIKFKTFDFNSGTRVHIKIESGHEMVEDYIILTCRYKQGTLFMEEIAPLKVWRKAFRQMRHRIEMESNPIYKQVHDRITGNDILSQMTKLMEKLEFNPVHSKTFYMNSKTAKFFEDQIEIYREPAKLAGLNPPYVIIDDHLNDKIILNDLRNGGRILK